MKKFCAPVGRIQEQIDRLTPDEKARAASKSLSGMFADVCVQLWPSRAALITSLNMQRKMPIGEGKSKWRPVIKREDGLDGTRRRRR